MQIAFESVETAIKECTLGNVNEENRLELCELRCVKRERFSDMHFAVKVIRFFIHQTDCDRAAKREQTC